MKLVIVESPAKCTTIKRYLGEDYRVEASLGHVRDLATRGKGGLGVDVDNGFAPTYIINKEKEKVVYKLRSAAKEVDEVILATDPDREGEAIAWHLAKVLNLNPETAKRLEFHEITRASITEAMNHPRTIDKNLVASQETRRIVDRIIGFKLSTLMYKKIHSRSAGRVQSATLKLIADHDKEIDAFVPEEYWNILTNVKVGSNEFQLTFAGKNGKKVDISNEKSALEILNNIPDNLTVTSIKKEYRFKESKEPFTTSTMQQEAFARLKFKTDKTQREAQKLYEGINVGDEHVGLITYMRTDSTRLSDSYITRATNYILEAYGKEYLGHVKRAKNSDLAQDAHEAIRPTSNHRTPESIKAYLTTDQYRLYKLIYNRALASLMKPKKEEVMTVTLEGNGLTFKFELTHTVFKGYEVVLVDPDEPKDYSGAFPNVEEGILIPVVSKNCEQKFTQPPQRFSEAKLVKTMEEVGIGRPSTYASTIKILKERKYIEDANGILTSTDQGKKTIHILEKYFPDIVNAQYTAQMEEKLDNVQEGNESRLNTLSTFYDDFMKELDVATKKIYIDEEEPTGEKCPICGSPLVYKDGANGRFVGCSNYPACKYVKKEPKQEPIYTGEMCPICGKPLVERETSKGTKIVACSGFPSCKYIKPTEAPKVKDLKIVKPCPECGGGLIRKRGKHGYFLACTNYPNCRHMEKIIRRKRK